MTFDHRDPGTDEAVWQAAIASRDIVEADLSIDALLVVAAHPDDETLGVGGLMHRLNDRGIPITVLVATDGEASHPESTTTLPLDLAERRRAELRTGLALLAPDADIRFLGIPDGLILESEDQLEAAVDEALRAMRAEYARALVVAPWQGDRHRDHRATGAVVQRASKTVGVRALSYPIWLWHWGTSVDVPWDDARFVALTESDRAAKRAALAAQKSQVQPLSPLPGDEAMLHPGMLAHFDRPAELLFTERAVSDPSPAPAAVSVSPSWFESFYARHDDPWGFESRWYEERKRMLLMACLPARRYDRALELGSATGALTALLAERCDEVVAVDAVPDALARARERLSEATNIDWRQAQLPGEWPEGSFDLVVLSEIGYYWDAPDLDAAVSRILGSLADDGVVVACHWRHPVAEHPVTGDGVHIALRTVAELVTTVHHEEEDFLLEVFARPPAPSVAEREGLVS